MGARSRRLLMVITQEPTQSLTALHRPGAADACIAGEQQDVVLPLMIALSMVMLDVFAQGGRSSKRITLDKHSSFTDLTQRSARQNQLGAAPPVCTPKWPRLARI